MIEGNSMIAVQGQSPDEAPQTLQSVIGGTSMIDAEEEPLDEESQLLLDAFN
jgi:hypothetical protein